MRLTAFQYGKTYITERMAFPNGNSNEKITIALLFFLIETNGMKILVDAGCDTMPGFELSEFQSPVQVLESYSIKRDEITHIILSHSHHDHVDGVRHYPNAKVYIHEAELKDAKPYFSNTNEICTFSDVYIIADSIQVMHIGGHSEGSSIVIVENKDKKYVLCGDECYTRENLIKQIPTGSSFCPKKSKMFVEKYSDKCYTAILFHDIDVVGEKGFKIIFDE